MKKRVILSIICVLAMAFAFTACGQSEEPASDAEETTAAQESEVDYKAFGEKALDNATELAGKLDQADVETMLKENTEHCDAAKNIEKAIDAYMKEHPEITYAYVIRYKDADKKAAEFLVNWEDTDEYWGEDFELYDESIAALNGEAVYDKEPTTDEDGTVITGYAPVKIGDEVPIVVCVDYAVEE